MSSPYAEASWRNKRRAGWMLVGLGGYGILAYSALVVQIYGTYKPPDNPEQLDFGPGFAAAIFFLIYVPVAAFALVGGACVLLQRGTGGWAKIVGYIAALLSAAFYGMAAFGAFVSIFEQGLSNWSDAYIAIAIASGLVSGAAAALAIAAWLALTRYEPELNARDRELTPSAT